MSPASELYTAPWSGLSVGGAIAVSLTAGAQPNSGFFDAGGALTVHIDPFELSTAPLAIDTVRRTPRSWWSLLALPGTTIAVMPSAVRVRQRVRCIKVGGEAFVGSTMRNPPGAARN